MGSVGKHTNSYLQNYIKNNPWLNTFDENTYQMMIDNFKAMPKSQQFYYSLTDDEQQAIVSLQINTTATNEYMRSGKTGNERTNKLISDMKSAISQYGNSQPMTLYRGVSADEFNYILTHSKTEAFKSTSTDLNRANAFGANQGGYLVEYHTGRNTRMADVDGAPNANESEWVIDSGQGYRVSKVSDRHIIVYI